MKFSQDNLIVAEKILNRYDPKHRFSAIMPLLTLIQRQNGGYLDDTCIQCVADYLMVSYMMVYEVANFYSMYNLQPVGKYLIQMCSSIVCFIKDFENLYHFCKEITGTLDCYISADGLFSVKKVECLGACVGALAIRINDVYIEDVTKDKLLYIVKSLKKGVLLEDLFKEYYDVKKSIALQ